METRAIKYQSPWWPKQQLAIDYLSNDNDIVEVLYGSAAYCGKSRLGCEWQILRRLKYPGTRGLIGRSELKVLKETTMNTFWETARRMSMVVGRDLNINNQSNIVTFSNGSEILLKDLFAYPSDPHFQELGSLELTDYFIDEAAEVSKKAIDIVRSRCRYKHREYGIKAKGLLSCNPDKRSWLYSNYYLPSIQGTLEPWRRFVPGTFRDNPDPDPDYLQILSNLPEMDRKRLLDGDWDYDESNDRIYFADRLSQAFRDEFVGDKEKRITADIAALGPDRTVICVWLGLTLTRIVVLRQQTPDEVERVIEKLCQDENVIRNNLVCDQDGMGIGVVSHLKCRGFLNGGTPQNPLYSNMKAQCYFKLGELINENKITFQTYDYKDQIIQELEMIRRKNPNKEGKISVTSKDEIAKQHGRSPDIADAIMMRMFFELMPNYGKYASVRR